MEDDWPSHRQTALSCEVNSQPLTEAQRRRAELFRLTRRGVWFLPGTPLFYQHLLCPSSVGKIILGDLGIENGKLRMENY